MTQGETLNLFVAIVGGKVRAWHYVMFTGAVLRRRAKRQYTILEDNDPAGFKASVIVAKAEFKIKPLVFPTYFPDINPCDHTLRDKVERCMPEQAAPKYESMQAFKLCLQKAALSIPCGGGHVARDRCTPVIAAMQ